MGFKDRAKQRVKALSEGDRFKLKEGENFLRVLPTPESEEGADDDILYEMLVHFNVGPDGKGITRCGHSALDKTEGECYICDVAIPKLIRKGHNETAKKLKPRWNGVVQVLRGEEQGEDQPLRITGPHVYITGGDLGKAIFTLLSAGKRQIYDPVNGFWFTVVRTGSGLDTEYSTPILDDEPTKIPQKYVDMLKPFVQLTEVHQYDEQVQRDMLLGNKTEDRPATSTKSRRSVLDDDEDEAPAKPKGKRVAADEDDEEPAPKPAAKAAGKPKRVVEPEPDEDEAEEIEADNSAEDVEDEEPAPPPKKTAVKVAAKTPAKRAPEPEPEEDEDEGEVEADGDEEVEAEDDKEPAPAPKKTAAKVVVKTTSKPAPASAKAAAKTPAKATTKKPPVDADDDDDPFGDD